MTLNQFKLFAIALIALPLIAFAIINMNAVSAGSKADEDAAAVYKKSCAMCHSPKAEKAFDPAKTDEELVEIILNGKKAAKPPNMPAYKDKMTKEQAQALVTFMKDLRKPSN